VSQFSDLILSFLRQVEKWTNARLPSVLEFSSATLACGGKEAIAKASAFLPRTIFGKFLSKIWSALYKLFFERCEKMIW